jgi:hypothetical protein
LKNKILPINAKKGPLKNILTIIRASVASGFNAKTNRITYLNIANSKKPAIE